MRNLLLCFLTVLISCETKLTAEEVVQNAIENAHGGKVAWETIKEISYEKTTVFYDVNGNQEQVKKQIIHTVLQPKFTSSITWKDKDVEKHIVYNGNETTVFYDSVLQTEPTIIQNAYKDIMGAHFVFWQPYKLLTDTATVTFERKVRLEDGTDAYMIKATYPESDAVWWFYFDIHTGLFKENLVKHGKTFSHIKNIQHENETGLKLHKERKSFLINEMNDQKYLRAHYHYRILSVKR